MDGCEWDKTNKTADIVKSFREEIYKLRTKINEKISAMEKGLQIYDKKSEKYSKTLIGLSVLASKLKELNDAEDELNYMETNPDIVFRLERLKEDPSSKIYQLTNGALLREKIKSDTTSVENGKVVMRYNRGDFDSLSHELKHGFQFSIGEISFSPSGKGGGYLYDLPDEQASWKRGSLFSTKLLDSLIVPSIKELREIPAYKGIPSQIPLNMHSTAKYMTKIQRYLYMIDS